MMTWPIYRQVQVMVIRNLKQENLEVAGEEKSQCVICLNVLAAYS